MWIYKCLIHFPLCSFSDLALRNCYLTGDLTVKVGDYGIGPYRYKVSNVLRMKSMELHILNSEGQLHKTRVIY